jgi:uncharacterized protein (TIGR03067 family)
MRALLLSALAVTLFATAACSRPRLPAAAARDPGSSDLDRLQGAWRIESSWWNGAPEPEAARTVTILFQGNRCLTLDRDGKLYQEETIELLPDRHPRGIDRRGKDSGPAAPGIYSLEGDTLTWCSAGVGRARPTSFSSEPGSRRILLVLRRQKNGGDKGR